MGHPRRPQHPPMFKGAASVGAGVPHGGGARGAEASAEEETGMVVLEKGSLTYENKISK